MVAVAVLGLAGTGALAQGVTFSGSGDLGVKYAGDTKEDGVVTMKSSFSWVSNFDLAMSASGTTDGGLTFGAGATVKAGNSESVVGASNAYIGGESWKISIGDLDPASHKGQSIGDIGFDGLGVDNVAEEAVGATAADVEVSFNLGAASLAITAGQTGGEPRKMTKAAVKESYFVRWSGEGGTKVRDFEDGVTADDHYAIFTKDDEEEESSIKVFTIVGKRDVTPGKATDDDQTTADVNESDEADTLVAEDERVTALSELDTAGQIIDRIAPSGAVYSDAMKQDTQWAAGVSFAVGATTLGIGMDSEKLMQASISADLGAFGGKLFYSQQKDKTIDVSGEDEKSGPGNTVNNKKTGIGAEISVSAGANTTINAVYTQGKQTDTRVANEAKTALVGGGEPVSMTTKGFGVGVSHGLGGGATLNAGFAKVADITKASVGVSMSF